MSSSSLPKQNRPQIKTLSSRPIPTIRHGDSRFSTGVEIEKILQSDEKVQKIRALLDAKTVNLDDLIEQATQLTQDRFGKSDGSNPEGPSTRPVLLYAPIYLASGCVNQCVYCGFNAGQHIHRRQLTEAEMIVESEILVSRGMRHQLLVAGEIPSLEQNGYFPQMVRCLDQRGVEPAVEIAPQSVEGYAKLAEAGTRGVTLYQETYDRALYAGYHPQGPKASYDWRVEGPSRAAEAGIERIGLGILLGLADPAEDLPRMVAHARVLQRDYPEAKIAFSLPRIHRSPDSFVSPYTIDDTQFLRLYCALRVIFPEATLVLSTRERAELRNQLVPICITQMSAGSSTSPGGYSDTEADGQFPITDERSVEEVLQWLQTEKLKPVWNLDAACSG